MICIFIATAAEMHLLKKRLRVTGRHRCGGALVFPGAWCGVPCLLVQSGVGPRKAAAAAGHVVQRIRPHAVILAGAAGALDPSLDVGDIVVADRIWRTEKTIACDQRMTERAVQSLRRQGRQAVRGACLTSRRFIHRREEKKTLFLKTGALAVEMESAAAARVFGESGIACINLRVISDCARTDTFDAETLFRRTAAAGRAGKALYCIRHPAQCLLACRFAAHMLLVRRRLADVVMCVLRDL
jgi:adenosylhomocysteine nucleosidase